MKMSELHKEFIAEAEGSMFGTHGLPIEPTHSDQPVIVMDRWRIVDNVLVKKYMFRTLEMRNSFVRFLLSYEGDVQHSAKMIVDEKEVTLKVKTKDVDKVTELDKEYARFADATYKDVVYNPVL